MGEVVLFPGVDVEELPGTGRPDMSASLHDLALSADQGEFVSLVAVAVKHDGRMVFVTSTPWLSVYPMLGGIEALKAELLAAHVLPAPTKLLGDYDNDPDAA